MEGRNFFERMNQWIRDSITIKLILMLVVILLLLIPSSMIASLVNERNQRQNAATAEISQKWAHDQVVTGPMLIVPFKETHVTQDDRVAETTRYAYFLPDELGIRGSVTTQTRYRGIYEAVVYTTDLAVSGVFAAPDFSDWNIDASAILWDEASLAVGIRDMRGINDNVTLSWRESAIDFEAGVEAQGVIKAGMSAPVTVGEAERYAFRFDISLNGSRSLRFVPVGKESTVRLTSSWSAPSFDGAFLPHERTIEEDGFTASWRVLNLNRSFPQAWRDETSGLGASAFGVTLLIPVDHYRKSSRAAKYAILVITLTFLAFFLTEILCRKRAHPFQYILIGLALCLFYALLLSLSEHISFNLAYAMAAAATIGAVALYVRSVFKTRMLSLMTGGVLVVLYGFVYMLLQMEDHALLVGSIGMFVALGLTMFLSRNINWFQVSDS